jgi:hypothetical protein
LIKKLEYYGVKNEENNFFQSYLKNRQQFVEIDGVRSESATIQSGVPQGSILGPLLFIIYINDLPCITNTDSEIVMFADDTSLILKGGNDFDVSLRNTLETLSNLENWFSDNSLVLNMTKTNAINFSLGRSDGTDPVRCALIQKEIELTDSWRFLGVTVDKGLQWNPHIDQLCSRLNSAIYAIKKIKDICGITTAKSVYYAYFHSIMSYGVMFWGMGSGMKRVFILQKRAVRTLLGMSPRDSCREVFKENRILTLPSLFIFECLKYAHKNLENTPQNLKFHQHDTRNKTLLRPVEHRLAKLSKSFVCMSVRLYNRLPSDLKLCNFMRFQREVKRYLVENAFYSIDDMLAT